MIKNERLVLAAAAFDAQLKAALTAMDEEFRKPIKSWLIGLKDREREVDGTVKAYIRPRSAVEAYDSVDGGHTEKALLEAVSTNDGKIDKARLVQLIEEGLLVPVGGADLAKRLVDWGIGTLPGYTIAIPAVDAGWTDELRFGIMAKGKFEGLKESLSKTVDLASVIRKTANEIENVPLTTTPPIGKVAIKSRTK